MEVLPEVEERRLVIAIDYGTTYTGVAIATPVGNRAILNEIDLVQDWGPGMGNHKKILSVISYSLRTAQGGEQQWGASLSPDAIAMVHTKLQLDVDDTSAELDLILQGLDGMHDLSFKYIKDSAGEPKYTRKSPEQIVEDYMRKVFEYLLVAVESFTEALRVRIPVDIVTTVPAEWGYRAKNSTFRALTQAGFNKETFPNLRDTLLVTEPEAAAVYTARSLKEEYGADFLRRGECFVLCDAGGGTVDVVSYKVMQLHPTFEIEPVTLPTGDKCGSIFINLAFKKWLQDLIGDDKYQELDPDNLGYKIRSHDAEGRAIRELMKSFDVQKRRFAPDSDPRGIKIDLPEPHHNLDMENLKMNNKIVGGQVTIKIKDMESFFEPRATRIVELIQGQLEQIEAEGLQRTRLRYVFLVGGFAESAYLQDSIRGSLDMRGLELRIPDTSWTAVVRGAAILGIEKSRHKALSTMTACSNSYGVSVSRLFSGIESNIKDREVDTLTKTAMARKQLTWLIKKGDLILSNQAKEVAGGPIHINFTASGPRTGKIPIYAYDGDDMPDRLSNSEKELHKCHVIEYDLKEVPLQDFDFHPGDISTAPYFSAGLTIVMRLAPPTLQVELQLKKRVVYAAEFSEPSIEAFESLRI